MAQKQQSGDTFIGVPFTLDKNTFSVDTYDFLGWSRDKDATEPEFQDQQEVTFDENTTLYAIWVKKVTITFDSNGGTQISPITVHKGTKFGNIHFINPTKTGYNIIGWFTKNEGGELITNDFVIENDITVYAHWQIISYTISYNLNGHGEQKAYGPTSYNIESSTITPSNPSEIGWNFTSWTPSNIPSGSIGDKEFKANWKINTYTITTSVTPSGSGTVTGGGTYEYGKTVTLTATPNTNYEFIKWSDENTDNPRTITVTEDKTYTAIFEDDFCIIDTQGNYIVSDKNEKITYIL